MKKLLVSLTLLTGLLISSAGFAQQAVLNDAVELTLAKAKITEAAATGDVQLLASVVAAVCQKTPGLTKQTVAFAVQKNPQAGLQIVKTIQQRAPGQAADAISAATAALGNSASPNKQALIAQILSQVAPAAGGANQLAQTQNTNNSPPPPPPVVLPITITRENPSQVSPN